MQAIFNHQANEEGNIPYIIYCRGGALGMHGGRFKTLGVIYIAEQVGLTPRNLRRLFQDQYGITPTEYRRSSKE